MKTVIFACLHNAGRSQLAEAFFNERVAVAGRPKPFASKHLPAKGHRCA